MRLQRSTTIATLLLIVLILSQQANAQEEMLVGLSSYPINTTSSATQERNTGSLSLPFFDDFSKNETFPNIDLWQNSGVITNLNYAISPITIGTATFDAATSNGNLYQGLSTHPMVADILTSNPIDLEYAPSDSIYFSFYIQPQGLGYAPNKHDSLVLEFCDTLNQWHSIWSAWVDFSDSTLYQKFNQKGKISAVKSNSLHRSFHNVMLPIVDKLFLFNSFKFRLKNYASIAQNQSIPGLLSNCDHWILDLVYLNSNRFATDTVFNDIAFSKPIKPLMYNYTSLPWQHFQSAYNSEFNSPMGFGITYTNLGYTTWNITRRFSIIDQSGLNEDYIFSGGAENIFEKQEIEYTRNFEYDFSSAWDDSAKFTLKSHLITDDSQNTLYLRNNDSISSNLYFHNYYAYDDGSAESGYGVFGEGTSTAMIACKFNNYKADTIKGIMIYFNKTLNNGNETSFKLTIWNDNNGKPGSIIAQRIGVRTLFTDSLNQFTYYRINPTFIPEGTFYIGWVQIYECMMNVGFDLNNNNRDKLFVNLGSGWTNTKFDGTLMIRPIMGNMHQWATNITCGSNKTEKFTLFPNPAQNTIRLKFESEPELTSTQIFDSNGRCVLTSNSTQQIDVQSLPNGLYIIRVYLKSGKIASQKFIIQR